MATRYQVAGVPIVGTDAADTLDGAIGSGFYTELYGGGGNDVYFIDAQSTSTVDKVIELPGGGVDKVVLTDYWNGVSGNWTAGSITYLLPDNIEILDVLGASATVAGGTATYNNFTPNLNIIGNALANSISTGSGADTLFGGLGGDTMAGGYGADQYYVDDVKDVVVENPALTGTDTVYSKVDFVMGAGIENLYLDYNAGNLKGTGNALDNLIYGTTGSNTIDGGAGNDTIEGGGGKDVLKGGDGNDVLVGDGHYYTNVLFDSLTATTVVGAADGGDLLDGGNGNDSLSGATGDTLLGGAGNDTLLGGAVAGEKITMDGGLGDDLFKNFAATDVVKDTGGGIDTALIDFGTSPVSYILDAGIERGILSNNSTTTADSLTGNALGNFLLGNGGNDTLSGLAGNDTLDGGTGADIMLGGDGNDSYMVDDLGDVVVEASSLGGGDTVYSYITSYTLGANVENLVLEDGQYSVAGGAGTGAATNGVGNALNNLIVGNSKANLLMGMDGADTLVGGSGKDTLIGGSGNDVYYVDNRADIVQELSDFVMTPVGGLATTVTGGVDTVFLANDLAATVSGGLYGFNGDAYTMGRNVENLDASAIIGAKNSSGVLSSGFTITGNESANKITGSLLNDTIIGGAGNDTMLGGAGNDTYYVTESGDQVSETIVGAAGGVDTVYLNAPMSSSYILPVNVENLFILAGGTNNATGNALDNVIYGNSGSNNIIGGGATATGGDTIYGGAGSDFMSNTAGNNYFDGGTGNDTMIGGVGNDIFIVDAGNGTSVGGGDSVSGGAGIDTIRSYVYSYTLATGNENLELMGSAVVGIGGSDNNKITGNAYANSIDGGAGSDTLDGGANADTMIGGIGNDTFYVDNIGDIVQESSSVSGGIDTVISTISYSLADTDGADTLGGGVENLTLASTVSGGAGISATGNAFNNIITGNELANVIDGGAGVATSVSGGADTMVGGDGNDVYFVDDALDVVKELSNVATTVSGALYSTAAGSADEVYLTMADGKTFNMLTNALNVERVHILDHTDTTVGGLDTVNVIGNASDNIIWGGKGANSISGGDGNDIITGGAGSDTLLGGNGNDVLDGDGLYQNNYNGSWIDATIAAPGKDSMDGGAGSDIYYVDIGDGAGTVIGGIANEDVVNDTGGLVGSDTVKLVGSAIGAYTLDTAIENLDASGLGSGSLNAMGNASANILTGLSSAAYSETLQGGDGNDLFILTPTSGAADSVRGGIDTIPGADALVDASKGDTVYAKPDASGGAVSATIDLRQIEAVTLDVSNDVNGFTWTFVNFVIGDTSNFTQPASSVAGGIAPTFTITGGVIGGLATAPDTSSISVAGNITLTNVSTTPTYILSNYRQATNLSVTTTFNLQGVTGTSDSLHVVLDNHRDGGLAAAGIETLFLNSVGDPLNNTQTANRLNVSAVTHTTGGSYTLIDATGTASLGVLGLQDATGATAAQTVSLHDYAAAKFSALLNNNAGTDYLHLKLSNVATTLTTDAAALENLDIDVTGSGVLKGSTINAGNAALAGTVYLSGGSTDYLTLDQFTGTLSTVATSGFNSGFTGNLTITASGAVTLTADGGNITFSAFNNTTLSDPAAGDSFIFNTSGGASSLDNLDSIDGGGGTDSLVAAVDELDAATTGQLHIANVENITFTQSSAPSIGIDASIDATFITGANTVTFGTGAGGIALSVDNLAAATVTGSGTFAGNLSLNLTDGVDHTITGGLGSDTIVSGDGADSVTITSGSDLILTGDGDDTIVAGNSLNVADTINGGSGADTLSFTSGASNDLDNVTNIEIINLGAAATSITTLDSLVAAGMTLTVNGPVASALTWTGSSETDGNFSITGGSAGDTLKGGDGSDTLIGGLGADFILGNAGDDTISMVVSSADSDTIDGGTGNDTLLLTGAGPTNITYMTVDLSSVSDQLSVIETVTLTDRDTRIQMGFENVDASGTSGTFYLTVNNTAATGSYVKGTANSDTINGNSGNDTLDGGAGGDNITGGGGNDLILWDKAAADVLDGGSGTDTLRLVTTTTGNITVDLSQVTDQVSTSIGNQKGFENLDASALTTGILTATAAASGSMIVGGGAADTITGGVGVDTLVGGAGADSITGGGGQDILTGGSGADHFVFNTTPQSGEIDTITDFTSGTDVLDLSHAVFDMITTTSGTISPAELISGSGVASSNTAGVVLVYDSSAGNLYYDADANGSGSGILIAHLDGTPALSASDINIIA